MGLSQSLYTGWTGLATHQRSLDNLGNNMANANTVGFKKSDFMFSDIYNQFLANALPGADNRTSVNPVTVGKGVTTGAILHNYRQGPIEKTSKPLDVAIAGNGFFMAQTNSGTALTRGGSFYLDHTVNPNQRMLCVGDGLPVQGWNAQDGAVTPTQAVENIYLPAIGDILPGRSTTSVDFKGILPTNTASADFAGTVSRQLELKGDVNENNRTLNTHIYAAVTRTDGTTTAFQDEAQEVKVEITFDGPALSPDGTTNSWTWTMKTVDWPNVGDPQVQIYPPASDPAFSQGNLGFYAAGSVANERGAGQVIQDTITPGSTLVKAEIPDGQGGTITTSFSMPSDFTLDTSRLSSLGADAPGGAALETWHVDGNPKGTMKRTVVTYDEYTEFAESTDANGNAVMEPVRRVEARQDTLYFEKTGSDNAGTDWSWRSSLDDASGTLRFNTMGDLVSSTSSGGGVAYNFSDVRSINSDGALQITDQDGYRDGFLQDVSIDQYGKIFGTYSNDVTELLAQLAIGTVPNLSGLNGVGGTLFYANSVSGAMQVGTAGDKDGSYSGLPGIGAGYLEAYALESSNVDLSEEFTNLIHTQRGYQLNGKTVTTSDEMLQTALGLKR